MKASRFNYIVPNGEKEIITKDNLDFACIPTKILKCGNT